MKLLLDTIAYTEKPRGYEIGLISKRIINNQIDIDVEQLAIQLGNGKTIVPASFSVRNGEIRRSIDNWESQQVLALDFDEGLTLEEAYSNEFFREYAGFLYKTFSHTEEHHKFRVVFVLDEAVTEYRHFQTIINELLVRFPYADQSCKDGSRIFFGGTGVVPFNYENRLLLEDFYMETPLKNIESYLNNMSTTRVSTSQQALLNNKYSASNVYLIKTRDLETLQERLSVEPIILSNNEVIDHLKRQDLRLFLGIEEKGNFLDIFHDENNPSASIYLSNSGSDHYLYKCFSTNYPFVGTIIHVVEKLLNCTLVEAKRFLMKVYQITVYESEAVKEYKENIDVYKELIRSDELKEIHPNFYTVFYRYGHLSDLYMLLDLTKEFITNDSDPRIVFFHSVRTLAKHLGRGVTATGTRLNFLALFNVIRKLDETEVPNDLLKIQKYSKKKNRYQYRNSTYEMPIYSYASFCEIDDMCKQWLKKGCTSRTISYEGIMRTFGREKADLVFPQDKGKEIAELNEDTVSQIHLTALKIIDNKGWTTEKEILDCISTKFKVHREFKVSQFKRCIGEMIDAYDLEIVNCNKKIKAEMNINESHMSKQSFPKLIRRKI